MQRETGDFAGAIQNYDKLLKTLKAVEYKDITYFIDKADEYKKLAVEKQAEAAIQTPKWSKGDDGQSLRKSPRKFFRAAVPVSPRSPGLRCLLTLRGLRGLQGLRCLLTLRGLRGLRGLQ